MTLTLLIASSGIVFMLVFLSALIKEAQRQPARRVVEIPQPRPAVVRPRQDPCADRAA